MFTTRPFLVADYDTVAELWKVSEGIELAEGDSKSEIAAYLQRNPNLSRVAELDSLIVGAVLCGHDGRRGLVYHLSVKNDARGKGIGKQLVSECMAGLREVGITRVILLVDKNNEQGQAFWTSQGFELIARAMPMGRDI
jgi:ribosomal protein S18 acetylase RimI-like enzyme